MMNLITLLSRKLWRGIFFANGIIFFLLFFPLFFVLIQREQWFPLVFRLKKFFSRIVLLGSGINYEIEYEAVSSHNGPCIFCPNHTSYLDIILSYIVIPRYFHIMGKAELKKVPLFNIFFKKMNIAVDRSSVTSSHRAFTRAAADIDKGISIAIFPEATIPNDTPRLGNFKNGPFKLAISKQVPVVPITFKNNWTLLPDGRKRRHGGKPGTARIVIHKPIETKGMGDADVDKLKQKVFEVIDKTIREQD